MNNWIKWEYSDNTPFPETEETIVQVQLSYMDRDENSPCLPVSEWAWGRYDGIEYYKVEM